ncbi:MAG: hypothetical protein ACF788_05785 [Novipirellula sp. JB048]
MKQILGWLLISSPFIGFGFLSYIRGELGEFTTACIVAVVIMAVIGMGMHLIDS